MPPTLMLDSQRRAESSHLSYGPGKVGCCCSFEEHQVVLGFNYHLVGMLGAKSSCGNTQKAVSAKESSPPHRSSMGMQKDSNTNHQVAEMVVAVMPWWSIDSHVETTTNELSVSLRTVDSRRTPIS